jgi:glycosyltransferase involved in cell wall biosynthesis
VPARNVPMEPVVSVILPVYNGEKYLRLAVDSILAQSLFEWELVIIDDGSTDTSPKILESYTDPRIKVFTNSQNMGVAKSLNRAIELSKGKYIARMDSDDIALPNRLTQQIAFLESHPDISICGGSIICIGTSSAVVKYAKTHTEIRAQCLFNTPFAHPVVCWRKADFERHNLRYQETPPTAEDYELWERATRVLTAANLAAPLIKYRIDPQIKISGYIKQQFEGAKALREKLLNDISEGGWTNEELELIHTIGEGKQIPSMEKLTEIDELFGKILKENGKTVVFDQNALLKTMKRYRKICFANHLAHFKSLFHLVKVAHSGDPLVLEKIDTLKLAIKWLLNRLTAKTA